MEKEIIKEKKASEDKELEQAFAEELSVYIEKNAPDSKWKHVGKTEWLYVPSGIAVRTKIRRSHRNPEEIRYTSEIYSLHNAGDLLSDANNEIIRNFSNKEEAFQYVAYVIG